jgi:hypothetical protein
MRVTNDLESVGLIRIQKRKDRYRENCYQLCSAKLGLSHDRVTRDKTSHDVVSSAARDTGKSEIRGWSIANLLAGGHWRDEQTWHWKAEHRPERKMRYVDLATLYTGPEYEACETRGRAGACFVSTRARIAPARTVGPQ